MMKGINERIAIVEEKSSSAHKRLDAYKEEIDNLREARHEHNILIHSHSGLLSGMGTTMNELSANVNKLTGFANKLIWITAGGLAVGSVLFAALIYVLKELGTALFGS